MHLSQRVPNNENLDAYQTEESLENLPSVCQNHEAIITHINPPEESKLPQTPFNVNASGDKSNIFKLKDEDLTDSQFFHAYGFDYAQLRHVIFNSNFTYRCSKCSFGYETLTQAKKHVQFCGQDNDKTRAYQKFAKQLAHIVNSKPADFLDIHTLYANKMVCPTN